MLNVRTRIAPSPTGFPHIGTIYQVLFDFAYAKKYDGKFILRIEDTDKARFVAGAEALIYKSLSWFGLEADEDPIKGGPYGPYRQSERLELYRNFVQTLVKTGNAYHCFCTRERLEEMRKKQEQAKLAPMYDKTCLKLSSTDIKRNLAGNIPHVARMKIPENRKIQVDDLIVGKVTFDSNTLDHQVILKSDGYPTYHLAVVVDDHLMEISHVFRGREWLSSTPKHILLYEYFGWVLPKFAHLPLILNSDGKGKLSKRQGTSSVEYYQKEGLLPDAVLNYLSNIVWNHPQGKEIYALADFIKNFDIKTINSQGARFNLQKLTWMNGEYIRNMEKADLVQKVHEYTQKQYPLELIQKLIPLAQVRMKTLREFIHYIKPFVEEPKVTLNPQQKPIVEKFLHILLKVSDWRIEVLETMCKKLIAAESLSFKEALMALRIAITGEKVGLPLFETVAILGKETVKHRLTRALQ